MRVVAPCLFVAVLVLFTMLHLVATATPVRLEVMPRRTVAPLESWHLRAWVERSDFNRALRVETHSDDYDRVSEIPLEGSLASRVHEVWWRGRVPCGAYLLAASVLGPSGQLLAQTRTSANICVSVEGP